MELEALERQTGDYGTVNAGDIVTISDPKGEELIAGGTFKKSSKSLEMATPEDVSARNLSGINTEPAGFDGTNREILNDEGRRLHESGPDLTQEATARVVAEVTPMSEGAPSEKEEKEEKATSGRQTKEDKAAKSTK